MVRKIIIQAFTGNKVESISQGRWFRTPASLVLRLLWRRSLQAPTTELPLTWNSSVLVLHPEARHNHRFVSKITIYDMHSRGFDSEQGKRFHLQQIRNTSEGHKNSCVGEVCGSFLNEMRTAHPSCMTEVQKARVFTTHAASRHVYSNSARRKSRLEIPYILRFAWCFLFLPSKYQQNVLRQAKTTSKFFPLNFQLHFGYLTIHSILGNTNALF